MIWKTKGRRFLFRRSSPCGSSARCCGRRAKLQPKGSPTQAGPSGNQRVEFHGFPTLDVWSKKSSSGWFKTYPKSPWPHLLCFWHNGLLYYWPPQLATTIGQSVGTQAFSSWTCRASSPFGPSRGKGIVWSPMTRRSGRRLAPAPVIRAEGSCCWVEEKQILWEWQMLKILDVPSDS